PRSRPPVRRSAQPTAGTAVPRPPRPGPPPPRRTPSNYVAPLTPGRSPAPSPPADPQEARPGNSHAEPPPCRGFSRASQQQASGIRFDPGRVRGHETVLGPRPADGLPDRSRTRHELGRTISADEDLRLFSGAFDEET